MRLRDVGIYLRKLPPSTRSPPTLPPPRTVKHRGRDHRYLALGSGPLTLVLVHGNPTNLLLWRHMLLPLSTHCRVLAIDLIPSDDVATRSDVHDVAGDEELILSVIAHSGATDVVLVGHDWGVTLALGVWQRLQGSAVIVRGLCFFEGLLYPLRFRDHNVVAFLLARLLQLPGLGALLLVHLNLFIRVLLPLGCRRRLRPDEHALYADRFRTRASRWAIWRWVQTVPASPRHPLWHHVDALREALFTSTVPKLWFYARPGFATCERTLQDVRARCRALTAVDAGDGVHYLSEDDPDLLVRHILAFLNSIEGPSNRV